MLHSRTCYLNKIHKNIEKYHNVDTLCMFINILATIRHSYIT